MENLKLVLTEVITHSCDVKTFRFQTPKDILFKPGQYLVLTLKIDGRDTPKAFSISNSPTEKGVIQFTKKLSASTFSKRLDRLEIGEEYDVRLPLGNFTFEGEYPKIAFLSGGIGITPIRSICKYASDKKLATSIVLLYSSRTPEYLIFRSDFSVMQQENRNLKVIYTLTDCDERISGCRTGYIDAEMVRGEVEDYENRIYYICGPPAMVDAMRSMLLNKLSILPQHIITEDFLGY